MYLSNKRNQKQSQKYLINDDEPMDHHRHFTLQEIDEELSEYKLLLKRRVWRNMNKMRKEYMSKEYNSPELLFSGELKMLRPHQAK